MKKIYSILLVGILLVFSSTTLDASTTEESKKNLIDLSNLIINDYQVDGLSGTRSLEMANPANVLGDQVTYTFVIGKDFYTEAYFSSPNTVEDYLYIDWGFARPDRYKLSKTPDGNHFYATFGSESDFLRISHILIFNQSVDYTATSIMLYKGVVADFTKIYSTKSNLTPKVGYFLMDFDNKKTPTDIMAELSVTDNVVSLSNDIKIETDLFTPNENTLGEYLVRYEVADKTFNTSIYDVYVKLVDVTAPIINGNSSHTIELGKDTLTVDSIKSMLSVSDNYDKNLTVEDLILAEDTFSSSIDTVGTYKVVYELLDSSLNKSRFEVSINVIDTTKPVFSGPLEVFRYTTDPLINITDIKAYFTATDSVDGDVSSSITFSGEYPNIPGRYPITVSAKDKSNNLVTHEFYVNVVDGIPPEFSSSEMIISYDVLMTLDQEGIKAWLSEKLMVSTENIVILLNETNYVEATKSSYVYYSFEKDNQINYGRVMVEPKEKSILPSVIGLSVIVLNVGFTILYMKKKKY